MNDLFVYPETVGQFTGLFDKNGKEIYEGDRIKITRRYLMNSGIKEVYYDMWEVAYHDGMFCIKDYVTNGSLYDALHDKNIVHYEVIGNIHDNPELLK